MKASKYNSGNIRYKTVYISIIAQPCRAFSSVFFCYNLDVGSMCLKGTYEVIKCFTVSESIGYSPVILIHSFFIVSSCVA